MYNKDYQDYLNVLRAREARPPFSEIARLIASTPERGTPAIPLFAKFAGALLLGGIVAAGAWVLSAKFYPSDKPASTNRVNASLSYPSDVPDRSHESRSPKFIHANNTGLKFTNPTGAKAPVLHEGEQRPELLAGNDDSATLPLYLCPIREQPSPQLAADTRPIPPIALTPAEDKNGNLFFAAFGGAMTRQFSSNTAFQQTSFTDAFLGVGYTLSQNSSVRILAGEEVFMAPSTTTTNSITFLDTTFVHNGQSYQNVLGEIQSSNTPTLTRTYWLGASYRYTLGDLSNAIRPFAEIMAGGSTDGFLTHQSLGAEWIATSAIDLDFLFQASELFPINSGWLTKAGFSTAMEFRW